MTQPTGPARLRQIAEFTILSAVELRELAALWEADRAALEQANSKIAYYEGDGSVRAYEALIGTDAPRHKFTDEGVCIRCGEDAEEWDAGCVEELRAALYNLLAIIHHDGGHYTGAHGVAKSSADAIQVVCYDRAALERARALLVEQAEVITANVWHIPPEYSSRNAVLDAAVKMRELAAALGSGGAA